MSVSRAGRVALVGAGPGNPELITLRGANLLGRADVVVYDALTPQALLALVPSHCECINVGKRGHDDTPRNQDEINRLIVERALQGSFVVRLKGGDPNIFGRGGEEASACVAAKIPFEMVPGVSSVVAASAYAGVPLTDRRHAASFAVVTGHNDPSRVREAIDWPGLAESVDTLVILMGMRNLESVISKVALGSCSPKTPAMAVMWASSPKQRVVVGTLDTLVDRVGAAGLGAPAVVVIGEVVKLRESLNWFEKLPLGGRRILLTRPLAFSQRWADYLESFGAQPVIVPMLEIARPDDATALHTAIQQLEEFNFLVLTSANAVRALESALEEAAPGKKSISTPAIVVGPATRDAAEQAGIPIAWMPNPPYEASNLITQLPERFVRPGTRFLYPTSDKARESVVEGLLARGASVTRVAAYETRAADWDKEMLSRALFLDGFDALIFASPSAVEYFFSGLDTVAREAAQAACYVALGTPTADALRVAGADLILQPEDASIDSLAQLMAQHFAAPDRGDA